MYNGTLITGTAMTTNQADLQFLSGGGTMGRQIAETDWARHPMGPAYEWTPACRTALSMVLNSGFPSYILWGPEYFVFYNDAYIPILGDKIEFGQGCPLSELWSEIRDEACQIADIAFGGEATFFKDRAFLLERSGHPQQAYFTFSFSPIRDGDGAVVGVLCTIVETTDRMLSMRQLQDSEDRLQLSLDASGNIGTWSWYPQTNTTIVDERFARLFQVDAALAQSGTELERFTNMIHPDDRERVMSAISHSITTGDVYEIDYRIPQLSGQLVWVTAKGKMFEGVDGIKRFAGVAVDITEQRKKQDELARLASELTTANSRQTEFIATLAHELRNPLAPILTGLELLRLDASNPQTLERVRGMMERQVTQLTRLIDDLLDISRINNGKVELQRERMDIGLAIAAAAETSLPHIELARHRLIRRLPGEVLTVYADPTRLEQILSNILTNAAKYTPDGGQIELRAWRDGAHAVVSITDSGIGIPESSISGIFDMFSQVHANSPRAQGGLGIGLALVKRLVELHGGTVSAASQGHGQGATFAIRLPLAGTDNNTCHAVERVPVHASPELGSYRILVADDNVDAAETLASILRIQGHFVDVAADGDHALRLAHAIVPDVAFLDIGMPRRDGHSVALEIRLAPELKKTLLVALTGWGSATDRALSNDAGFDHHLTKPVSMGEINKIMRSLHERER
jgi:signal transduction histidine kinase/ActR/RegA family two-component response regulator